MALKIIGAGLGRTGTMSTKVALEQLGFGPCFHMAELIMNMGRLPGWERVADGDRDWDAAFDGYAATVDYPARTYWRELAAYYPDAKVLLTVRDADSGFESTQATIFSAPMRSRLSGCSSTRYHRAGSRSASSSACPCPRRRSRMPTPATSSRSSLPRARRRAARRWISRRCGSV